MRLLPDRHGMVGLANASKDSFERHEFSAYLVELADLYGELEPMHLLDGLNVIQLPAIESRRSVIKRYRLKRCHSAVPVRWPDWRTVFQKTEI